MDIRVRFKRPKDAGTEEFPASYVFNNVQVIKPISLRSEPGYSLIGQSETGTNDRLSQTVIDVHPEDRRFLSSPLDRFGNGRTIAEYQLTEVANQPAQSESDHGPHY